METTAKTLIELHLHNGADHATPILVRARESLKKAGYETRVVGNNDSRNVAHEGRIVAVLPGGTKLHGVGDLPSRVEDALAEERQYETAMSGLGSQVLQPALAH